MYGRDKYLGHFDTSNQGAHCLLRKRVATID
jgi:hypothetical protein